MSNIKRRILSALMVSFGVAAAASAQTNTGGTFTSMSMAGFGPIVSPDSIAAGFGTNLVPQAASVTALPLGTTLGTAMVTITDSKGTVLSAPLYMVAPGQINYLIPANAALGKATISVVTGAILSGAGSIPGTTTGTGTLQISNVAPAIATANNSGMGVPAAQVLRVTASGTSTYESPFQTATGGATGFGTKPINIGSDKVYIVLYGTGIRRHSQDPVIARLGGTNNVGAQKLPVLYAGPQNQYPGLDQVNIGPVTGSFAGTGETNLVITVDGVPSNTVRLAFQ